MDAIPAARNSSTSHPPAITVLLTTYNRAADLKRTLQAYEAQITPNAFEILVVDDASTDATPEVLRAYQPQRFSLQYAFMEQNSGQGQARNRAIPLIRSPLVLFSGDDILPEPYFIEAHLAAHRLHPDEKVAILGRISWPKDFPLNTLMAHIDGVGAEQFSFYYFKDSQEYDFRHLYTSNISFSASLLHALAAKEAKESPGGQVAWFDPAFHMYGFEDVDLGYRLSKLGMRIFYSSTPVACHYHYHTAYSFTSRQYKSGRMACVLVQKHPELRRLIFGKGLGWYLRKAQLHRLLAGLHLARGYTPQQVQQLEARALRLLSFYELEPHALLDSLYTKILKYYFYKGIVDGVLAPSAAPGRSATSRGKLDPSPHTLRIDRTEEQSRPVQAVFPMQPVATFFAGPRLNRILDWYLRTAKKLQIRLPEGL